MMEEKGKEFQIGLTMSGAISAGAYTAGIFDFLIQALDEWELARHGPEAGQIPNHRVGIKVMSGASAGAITAAMGAVALADAQHEPARFDPDAPIPSSPEEEGKGIKCYLPKLYEIWVEKPGLVAEGSEQSDFLRTSDLDGPPDSLLNARLLDEIAKSGITVAEVVQPPSADLHSGAGSAKPVKTQRAYIAETLHIYMTLSNLRGIPYSVPFGEDAEGEPSAGGIRANCYHMISHGDRVHYAVKGLGTWKTESPFADNDKSRTIEAKWLVSPSPDPEKPNWKDYAVCAIASGAFPVGLAPRQIGTTLGNSAGEDEYAGRLLPFDALHGDLAISPSWLPNVLAENPFWFTTADGGIIDNDPFEYAHFSLKRSVPHEGPLRSNGEAALKLEDRLPSDLAKTERAVIMVSPFPEQKPIAPEGLPARDIVSIFSALLPALIDQARFKPSEITLAAQPDHGSRYLIGPSRVIDGKEQLFGIASGLLGGFGGFVAEAFRAHDFQLGRRNCQRFLQSSFALPADNDIIKSWPEAVDKSKFAAIQTEDEKRRNEPDSYCIIPLVGTAKAEVVLPPWPRISQARFDVLQTRIGERFDGVAPRLLGQNVTGILYFLLLAAVRPPPSGIGLIRDKVLNFVKAFMLADLVRRDMIEGWDLPPNAEDGDGVRAVLAELINPSYDLRSVAGLVKSTGLDRPAIEAALALCQGATAAGRNYETWRAPWTDKDGGTLYTLVSRKPKWYQWFRWRYFGWLLGPDRSAIWLSKPATDKPGV
jgi:hypothetical protein